VSTFFLDCSGQDWRSHTLSDDGPCRIRATETIGPGFLYLLQAFFDGHPYLRFGARNLSTQGRKDTTFFWMKDMKGTQVVTRCDVIPLFYALPAVRNNISLYTCTQIPICLLKTASYES